LPVGNLYGLRSPNFNAAKAASAGAVEYEYGPEYIMGSYIFARRFFITSLECQAALSNKIYEDSYQPGLS